MSWIVRKDGDQGFHQTIGITLSK